MREVGREIEPSNLSRAIRLGLAVALSVMHAAAGLSATFVYGPTELVALHVPTSVAWLMLAILETRAASDSVSVVSRRLAGVLLWGTWWIACLLATVFPTVFSGALVVGSAAFLVARQTRPALLAILACASSVGVVTYLMVFDGYFLADCCLWQVLWLDALILVYSLKRGLWDNPLVSWSRWADALRGQRTPPSDQPRGDDSDDIARALMTPSVMQLSAKTDKAANAFSPLPLDGLKSPVAFVSAIDQRWQFNAAWSRLEQEYGGQPVVPAEVVDEINRLLVSAAEPRERHPGVADGHLGNETIAAGGCFQADGWATLFVGDQRDLAVREVDTTISFRRAFTVRISPFLAASVIGWLVSLEDCTAATRECRDERQRRRMLECQLRLVSEELQDAVASTELKSRFLANASHELRTPLTAILGYAELLRDRMESPEFRDLAETILRNGHHLLDVVNEILDLSKIEAGKLEIVFAETSLPDLLRDVMQLVELQAQRKGLSLRLELSPELPSCVLSDAKRLRQILMNLVGNAIKFTAHGHVELSAGFTPRTADSGLLELRVHDTGIGLTREQTQRLFQPFTQVGFDTERQFGGTGLGLAIAKLLTELMQGRIDVESDAGAGTTFRVQLPVTVAAKPLRTESNSLTQSEPLTIPPGSRVLLAEDGFDNQRLIKFLLQRAGCEVTVVANGQEACVAISTASDGATAFDIVLMDMQIPIMDGFDATRQLRTTGCTLPIIAITANAMVGDREVCLAAGCTDYLSKPINREDLFKALARGLNSESSSSVTPLSVD